jgi:hypothetical protein
MGENNHGLLEKPEAGIGKHYFQLCLIAQAERRSAADRRRWNADYD